MHKIIECDRILWIEWPDEAWKHAEFVEYYEGIPWHTRR